MEALSISHQRLQKNSNIHKHKTESKRHICSHHGHIILQAFTITPLLSNLHLRSSQIQITLEHFNMWYSYSSSSRDTVWSQCSLLMQQRREGELGLSDQSLSLLIMRGRPCLTSLLVSLPCPKQMSSAADDKLHHYTLMKFIITGGGGGEWNGSFFNDLYTTINVQMTNVSISIQYLKFEIH